MGQLKIRFSEQIDTPGKHRSAEMTNSSTESDFCGVQATEQFLELVEAHRPKFRM